MIPRADIPLERIRALAADGEFIAAMAAFYERLDQGIAAYRPVCRNRGVCCRFGEFGHRLYVTPAELAYFVATVAQELDVPAGAVACPYQVGGLCDARGSRPLGCRVFFCESAGQGWQEALSGEALTELRGLHDRFDLPYAYAEWLDALRRVRMADDNTLEAVPCSTS